MRLFPKKDLSSKSSIGDIENGRINLDQNHFRIIVCIDGMKIREFERLMG
jgi:hypothetical protein